MAVPPLCSGALQEVRSKGDIACKSNIGGLHFISNVTEPVFSIKRLNRVAEYCWVEANKILQTYWERLWISIWMGELIHNPLHELMIKFELLHHSSHIIGWWCMIGTTTSTCGSNHPANN
jgi:hypothetical protein